MAEEAIKNPISKRIKENVSKSSESINIAVPFISSFTRKIFNEELVLNVKDKRLLTRFDDRNIVSFDIPTLKYFIELGFEIRYDNEIHLKLYIFDDVIFSSSSNMTKSGFEDNKELTVKIDKSNNEFCTSFFDQLWEQNNNNELTLSLLEENMSKYKFLKKKEKHKKINPVKNGKRETAVLDLDFELLTNHIFYQRSNYQSLLESISKANKARETFKEKLLENGYQKELFYVPRGDSNRKECLFYNFAWGEESSLAGTGLFENQFRIAVNNPLYENVIYFLFPKMTRSEKWDLYDDESFLLFCSGLFDFNISHYNEVLPIRLASFFFPDHFLPIFKLDHLKKICEYLGIDTNAKTKGERLYSYNKYIQEFLKSVPYNNYVKSKILYQFLFTSELYERLSKNEEYSTIYTSYEKQWERKYIEEGKQILIELDAIGI